MTHARNKIVNQIVEAANNSNQGNGSGLWLYSGPMAAPAGFCASQSLASAR